MKLKLTIIFLILAVAFVYLVFKGRYFSLNQQGPPLNLQVLTSEMIFSKLYSAEFRNYQAKSFFIAKNSLEAHSVVILHLWASWCAPCITEVPELIEYSKKHPEVKFIIISVDESKEDIAKFLISFPDFDSEKYIKIWDKADSFSKFFNVDRLPMSIILKQRKSESLFIRSAVDWQSLQLSI